MNDVFITKVQINKVRHLENVEILIDENERKNLIITGKNGSGKTSLLEAMRDDISQYQSTKESFHKDDDAFKNYKKRGIQKIRFKGEYSVQNIYNPSEVGFGLLIEPDFALYNRIFAYMPSIRPKFIIPIGVEKVELGDRNSINNSLSENFLKYMVGLDYQLHGAIQDNDIEATINLEKWLNNFEIALKDIYDCEHLKLTRETRKFAFKIELPNRPAFTLDEMSDGYMAFLKIYMEIVMRFEVDESGIVDYDKSAVVLIDEIDIHLHVELQKKILPFLTKMFPNVQFIVTTHSPFVINSIENVVVYDLETNERLENPSLYSYETILESYLNVGTYSDVLKNLFARYKELYLKDRTPEENDEFLDIKLDLELKSIPSTELYIAFQKLERERKAAKK